MNAWTLRFDPHEICYWAGRFPDTDATKDVPAIKAGQRARQAGYYTMDSVFASVRPACPVRTGQHAAHSNV